MKFPLAFPFESGLSQRGGGVYRVTGGCGFRHVSPACLGPPLWLTMSCERRPMAPAVWSCAGDVFCLVLLPLYARSRCLCLVQSSSPESIGLQSGQRFLAQRFVALCTFSNPWRVEKAWLGATICCATICCATFCCPWASFSTLRLS